VVDAAPPWSRRELALVGGLAALVVVTYHRVLGAGFVNWDDNRFLVDNPLFHAGGWTYIEAAVTRFQFEAYQPLHLLSYVPDRYLWPDDAAGFHAVEVALWIFDVGLVYALLRRHVWAPAALGACALFALHPLCVEPVAWITSRKDLVSLALFVGALLVEDRRGGASARPTVGVVLGLLAMLTKTSTVCLAPVVAAWLLFVRGASLRTAALRALPYGVVSLVCSAIVWWLWREHLLIADARVLPAYLDVPATLGTYLGRIVVPVGLAATYPKVPPAPWLAAIGFVAAVIAVGVAWRRLPRLGRFAAVGTLAAFLPVSNLIDMRGHFADRYALLPLFAIACGVAAAIEALARDRRAVLAIVAALALAEGVASWRLSATWHDTRALWTRAADEHPDAIFAHFKLGEALRDARDWKGAVAEYQAAIRLDPDLTLGYAGLLFVYASRAEDEHRVAPGTASRWLGEFIPSLEGARAFEAYYARVPYDACPTCSNLLLGVGLMRWPQPDRVLVDAAGRALDAGRRDTALVYLASVRDRATPGFAELAQRAMR
jgi:hypothetical protein